MKSSADTFIFTIRSRTSAETHEWLFAARPKQDAVGLQEYLVVSGEARVTEGSAVPLLQCLARIYMGPDADFPPAALRDRPGFVTRITPRRFSGEGPWSSRRP